MIRYFGERKSIEKRAGKWECAVKIEAIEFFELRNWKGATKIRDVWRNGIGESITRQEDKRRKKKETVLSLLLPLFL
jgi:hypothetical protein